MAKMKTDGRAFLQYLAGASSNRFELRFSRISSRLDLGAVLSAQELSLLYEAACLATLCNISFNGLGVYPEEILPERELARTMLESEFMGARARFFTCCGCQHLTHRQRGSIERIFLTVMVSEENLS